MFHPSLFETTKEHTPKDERVLMENKIEVTDTVTNLTAPKKFSFTEDDNKLSKSNTKALFRGLYGETLLTYLFFSEKNVMNIQNLIKMIVSRETGYVVDNQSNNELLIIMRSIFLEYSAHPKLIDPSMSSDEKADLYKKYTEEVRRLNDIVINSIVPKLISQMIQYVTYLQDASEQPKYMDRPINDSVSGKKDYRSITDVLTGYD
uniref:Minor capsid protein P8 central region domain-containing protein n=1 Tax=viral metagenome TaxID=1070528 RepID=A0A6C0E0K5_9ZZZZ